MNRNDETAGSEFDTWMGAGPSVKASADVEAAADEVPMGGSEGKSKATTALSTLIRKPMVLVPVVLGVAVVGLMLVRGGGAEPSPTESQYAALTTLEPEPTPAAAEVMDSEPSAYDQLGQPGDEAAVPLDAVAGGAFEQDAIEAVTVDPAPVVEPEVQPEPEPAPAPAPAPAAEPAVTGTEDPERSRRELELRIASLENDLDRAQQTREANLRVIRDLRGQLAKHEGRGSYSVIAVLNDGVVVRDNSGSERVYGLGARIGE